MKLEQRMLPVCLYAKSVGTNASAILSVWVIQKTHLALFASANKHIASTLCLFLWIIAALINEHKCVVDDAHVQTLALVMDTKDKDAASYGRKCRDVLFLDQPWSG